MLAEFPNLTKIQNFIQQYAGFDAKSQKFAKNANMCKMCKNSKFDVKIQNFTQHKA